MALPTQLLLVSEGPPCPRRGLSSAEPKSRPTKVPKTPNTPCQDPYYVLREENGVSYYKRMVGLHSYSLSYLAPGVFTQRKLIGKMTASRGSWFQWCPSSVKVPVLVIKYSLTATSFPLSFPYPDSLIPPKGDSAADWLPAKVVSQMNRHVPLNTDLCSFQSFLPPGSRRDATCDRCS